MGFVRDAFESICGRVNDLLNTRSVLTPNARTAKGFKGQVIGHFRRTGPNAWDDYRLAPKEAGSLDVYPATEVQVEPGRSRFRIRARGQVLMVQWVPDGEDKTAIEAGADIHELFQETCVRSFKNSSGMGAAALIAKTLRR